MPRYKVKKLDECKELICVVMMCFLKVALSKCLYMRGLFYVKFCMLSSHLWIIIRPKEYPECSP